MEKNLLPWLYYLISFISISLFASCANRPVKQLRPTAEMLNSSPALEQHFTGFVLYDPEAKDFLYEQNADKYMTPASNTKLYTFYAGLNLLGDSIPSIEYVNQNDTLYFWGYGDPSFLNKDFLNENDSTDPLYQFLEARDEVLVYLPRPMADAPLGPGWSWDDFTSYYSSERSKFPIYSNNMIIDYHAESDSFSVSPQYFESYVNRSSDVLQRRFLERNFSDNYYKIIPERIGRSFTRYAPFHYSDSLFIHLLSDTLKREIIIRENIALPTNRQTFYSHPIDTLYRKMLQPSDNLYAEQILLMCSAILGDTLSANKTIDYVKDSLFTDAPSELVWRDGSGLSRYNMFTPRTTVKLLEHLYRLYPEEQLLGLLPAGGVSGTIKRWYAGRNGVPYIFAKTGTLSNNHCLSGYLKTQGGKILLFSFMHNHYNAYSSSVKKVMQQVLEDIYRQY